MVVSGGCCGRSKRRIIVGGCAFAWCCVTDVQRLSLNVMTLLPRCEHVETKEGVALHVTGVAQVMVMAADHMSATPHEGDHAERDKFLHKALEQFLGKSRQEMENTILQTLEGHLRAILGTLTVEEVYRDRESFAKLVFAVATPDVAKMGLEILSFVIKDVTDQVDYLDSLGRAQNAVVQQNADIGIAEANRDAGIREADCNMTRRNAELSADTAIANSNREYQTLSAGYTEEVNQKKAEAELAYELQAAKLKQAIRSEEIEIDVVERRRQIEVEEQEVLRREKELVAQVHRPAEAERFRLETLAEANQTRAIAEAQGSAEATKLIGAAEASRIRAIGEAEADAMKARAAAYKQYGKAAIMTMVLEALPQIAAEVSAPLARTKEIVVLGGDESKSGLGQNITQLLSTLPPAVQAVSGVDISQTLRRMAQSSSSA